MAVAAVTYTFAPNTLVKAAEANQNFTDLVQFLNNSVIHKDGTVASTGTLSGPAADPVSGNQYARKAYVDKLGIVAQQVLLTSSGPHSADVDTDMVLNNVSVEQGRTYAIHCHFGWTMNIGGSFAEWNVNLKVNGALYDHFDKTTMYVTQQAFGTVDGTVYWTAPTTQATDDFLVSLDEVSGSFTLTLNGAANVRRTLTMIDLGVL